MALISLKGKLPRAFESLNRPWLLSALGFLLIVILLWLPFGLKTTDTYEGWANMSKAEANNIAGFLSRPLIFFPWKLATLIDNDSFVGAQLVFAAFIWGKSLVLYALLRKTRLATPALAFLVAVLFMLFPADQGNFTLRALGRQSAVFFYLLAVLFMALSAQKTTWYYVAGMLAAEAISCWTSEQGFFLIPFTPAVLLLFPATPRGARLKITGAWYTVFITYTLYMLTNTGRHSMLLNGVSKTPLSRMIQEAILSNLLAYRRVFVDGWYIALGNLGTFKLSYFLLALGITLISGGVAWLILRAPGLPEDRDNLLRHWKAIFLAGLMMVGLTFAPYSITDSRYDNWRVFYFAAIGAAVITGTIFTGLIKIIPRFKRELGVVLWGLTIFLIAYNGLIQHASFVRKSRVEQQILASIVEQVPAFQPNTVVVLLVDKVKNKPFENNQAIREAIHWLYQVKASQKINVLLCIDDLQNCAFTPAGLENSTAAPVPYENLLLFQYFKANTTLLEQVPSQYCPAGAACDSYQPYLHIAAYTPFPSRPQQAFDEAFRPNPTHLAPADWTGVGQTLNDRRVCDTFHTGQCALLFYGDAQTASFEQILPVEGGQAGERLELTFWEKAQATGEKTSPSAALTVFYSDSSTETFTTSTPLSAEWTSASLIVTPAKPYTRLTLSVGPNAQAGLIWLDDLHLARNGQEFPLTNPSFEK